MTFMVIHKSNALLFKMDI